MRATIDEYSNNCTLVAVREISGRPDQEIMERFLARGWRPGHGTYAHQYLGVLIDMGHVVERVGSVIEGRSAYVMTKATEWTDGEYRANSAYYMTANQFRDAYPQGVYLISTGTHAFVIRDGVIVDPNMRNKRTRQRVQRAWLVKNPATARVASQHAELTRDSMVKFSGRSLRRITTKSFQSECKAVAIWVSSNEEYVPLRTLLRGTGYSMTDARWDQRRGRLVVKDG